MQVYFKRRFSLRRSETTHRKNGDAVKILSKTGKNRALQEEVTKSCRLAWHTELSPLPLYPLPLDSAPLSLATSEMFTTRLTREAMSLQLVCSLVSQRSKRALRDVADHPPRVSLLLHTISGQCE